MRIGLKISLLAILVALLATAALTVTGYHSAKRQYLNGIDHQLQAVAAALPGVIGSDYLNRARADEPIDESEYARLVQTLNDLADRSGVYYVYVFRQRDGNVLHLATSASASERTDGSYSKFLEAYEEPPARLIETFKDGVTRFAQYEDEFGEFRSIFVRSIDGGREPYVVGVDISMSAIRQDLAALVWRYAGVGLAVAALAGGLGVYLARRGIVKPLTALSNEVEEWAHRDFVHDEGIRARLTDIMNRQRDETGDLAKRFIDVQDRLATYLVQLIETQAQKHQIEHQLEIAKSIQESLLPHEMPDVPNFKIFGWSQPADQTGGDYFDWLDLPDGRMVLTIGDVTGHGIGPALVTAASRAYARATFTAGESLESLVAKMNGLLHGDLKGERFVTLIACLLDPRTRHMQLVAAGHGPILYYSKRRNVVDVNLDAHGMPLGVWGNAEYDRPLDIQFEPGDVLVLVSDGFFDWMDKTDQTFGTDRLRDSVYRSCRDEPDAIIERLREDIARFNQGRGQADDTTALVVRCIG